MHNKTNFKFFILFTSLIISAIGTATFAQSQPSNTGPFYTSFFNNQAVDGYDVVSYFQNDGKPIKGNKQLSTKWKDVYWYFSSEENLKSF